MEIQRAETKTKDGAKGFRSETLAPVIRVKHIADLRTVVGKIEGSKATGTDQPAVAAKGYAPVVKTPTR